MIKVFRTSSRVLTRNRGGFLFVRGIVFISVLILVNSNISYVLSIEVIGVLGH